MSEKIEVKKAGFKMDKRLISCIIALIGSIMLIATLFLPLKNFLIQCMQKKLE